MIDIPKMLERWENLRDMQKFLQTEYISAQFTENNTKEMIYFINEYIALRQYIEKKYIELHPTPEHVEKIKEFSKLNSVYGILSDDTYDKLKQVEEVFNNAKI